MGVGPIMARGIFLDRDGVINPNVFNKASGEWESPYSLKDFKLFHWAIESLRKLQENKFHLFLISNQPGYAKGKTSLENIEAIHQKFHSILVQNKIYFEEYYYCYHHPQGIAPQVSVDCDCRKPGIFFLKEAEQKHSLEMSLSWMIGDRDSDIICGQRAGVKTVLILNQEERQKMKEGGSVPNFKVRNLLEAVNIIVQKS
jgi:D-glycero-D-manno-heptose 1,7-bisphosphate phosphatase